MNIREYLKKKAQDAREAGFSKNAACGLLAANILLASSVLFQKPTVVLVPPDLEKPAKVGAKSADAAYIEAWALFAGNLLGNVTPGSVDFVRNALGRLVSPDIYHGVASLLETQARQIKDDNVTLSFIPAQVMFEPETGLVFVTGTARLTGASGHSKREERTYEFRIAAREHAPVITWVDTYLGAPRTKQIRERMKKEDERRAESGKIQEIRSGR